MRLTEELAPSACRKTEEITRLKEEGVKPSEIARRLGIGRASVYRVLADLTEVDGQAAA